MALGDFQLQRGAGGNGTNAVRIPIQANRTAPQGQINSRMTAINQDDGSQYLAQAGQNMANAIGNAASQIASVAEYQKQKTDYQAKLEANNVYSSGLIDLHKTYEEMKLNMPLGGAGFADSVMKVTDEHIAKATEGKSQMFKEQYQQHANSLRVKMFDQAKHTEVIEGLKHESFVLDGEREKSSQAVRSGLSSWKAETDRLVDLIQTNPKLTATAKESLTKAAQQEQRFADQIRQIKEDPAKWAGRAPKAVADSVVGGAGGSNAAGFDGAVSKVLKHEGGYAAADGNTGQPVIYGINRKYNPDEFAEARRITKEDGTAAGKEYAAKVYREKYWNVIGGDKLPAELQATALDAAVNQGPQNAKKWIEESGGDVAKFNALRQAHYDKLAASGKYKDSDVASWNNRMKSYSGASSEPSVGTAPGGISKPDRGDSWDGLDFDNQQKLERFAEHELTKMHQAMVRERQTWATDLQYEMSNLSAKTSEMVQDATPWRKEEEFAKAYAENPEQGRRAYAEYAEAKRTNEAVSSMKGAPSSQLKTVVEETPPPADSPDFARLAAGQNARQKAAAAVLDARQKDPWNFATMQGDFGVKKLDPNLPLSEQLRMRYAAVPEMAKQYGFVPKTLLTGAETKQLSDRLLASTADGKMQLLEQLRTGIADNKTYLGVLQSIAPDSPVTANAGAIATQLPGKTVTMGGTPMTTAQVAQTILVGEELLNPPKTEKNKDGSGKRFLMPKEKDMRAAWETAVGDSYAGFPEAEHVAYQTFQAYYAGKASRTQGLGKPEDGPLNNVVKEAIDAATGGVVEWDPSGFNNSRKLTLPYGMPANQFQDAVAKEWAVVGKDFKRVKYDDIQLRPMGKGNGMYVVQLGTEDQRNKDGSLMVMDLSGYVK